MNWHRGEGELAIISWWKRCVFSHLILWIEDLFVPNHDYSILWLWFSFCLVWMKCVVQDHSLFLQIQNMFLYWNKYYCYWLMPDFTMKKHIRNLQRKVFCLRHYKKMNVLFMNTFAFWVQSFTATTKLILYFVSKKKSSKFLKLSESFKYKYWTHSTDKYLFKSCRSSHSQRILHSSAAKTCYQKTDPIIVSSSFPSWTFSRNESPRGYINAQRSKYENIHQLWNWTKMFSL